jgi:hypothetical protein
MLSGLNLLNLFLMSSNIRKGKRTSLLMLCLGDILTQLDRKIFALDTTKTQYVNDADFKDVLLHFKDGKVWNKFVVNDGFVFRANELCIPASSVRLLLLQEAHGGGLMGHFGAKKTEDVLAGHFFWPKMRRDVERFVARCTTCRKLSHV